MVSRSNLRDKWCQHPGVSKSISAQIWAEGVYICQISRSIRVCCLEGLPEPRAHWWLDIYHRFIDLKDEGIGVEDPDIAEQILDSQDIIEEQLLERVSRPSEDFLREFSVKNPFHHSRKRWSSKHPSFARSLGLEWPASEEQVKTRFRELSKTVHPDKGGDTAAFAKLSKAYHQAMDEARIRNAKRPKLHPTIVATAIHFDKIVQEVTRG